MEDQKILTLQPGAILPAATGVDRGGWPMTVEYGKGSPETLFLVFSPECGVCDANWPRWLDVIRAKGGLRIVAINISRQRPTTDYEQRWQLGGLETIAAPDAETVLAYNLRFTPQTILVGADGKVLRVWSGMLDRKEQAELATALRIKPVSTPNPGGL